MKEARDPEFYIARLMTCNNEYRKFYTKRIREMEEFESPLIFPESVLSIDQKALWSVNIDYVADDYPKKTSSFRVYVMRLDRPRLAKVTRAFRHDDICDYDITYDDIILAEEDNPPFIIALCVTRRDNKATLNVANATFVRDWISTPYIFTNEKAAKEFRDKKLKRIRKEQFKTNNN